MRLLHLSRTFAIFLIVIASLMSIAIINVAAQEDLNETVSKLNETVKELDESIRVLEEQIKEKDKTISALEEQAKTENILNKEIRLLKVYLVAMATILSLLIIVNIIYTNRKIMRISKKIDTFEVPSDNFKGSQGER